jgi:hypothetical protein
VRPGGSWDPAPVPSPDDFGDAPFGRMVFTFEPIGQPMDGPPVKPWRLEIPRGRGVFVANQAWRDDVGLFDDDIVYTPTETVLSLHILPTLTDAGITYRLIMNEVES